MTDQPADFPPRALILADAIALVCGEREQDYGPPVENMARIARYFTLRSGIHITAWHAALFLECLKMARNDVNRTHHDSAADKLGYGAIMHECAMAEGKTDAA